MKENNGLNLKKWQYFILEHCLNKLKLSLQGWVSVQFCQIPTLILSRFLMVDTSYAWNIYTVIKQISLPFSKLQVAEFTHKIINHCFLDPGLLSNLYENVVIYLLTFLRSFLPRFWLSFKRNVWSFLLDRVKIILDYSKT